MNFLYTAYRSTYPTRPLPVPHKNHTKTTPFVPLVQLQQSKNIICRVSPQNGRATGDTRAGSIFAKPIPPGGCAPKTPSARKPCCAMSGRTMWRWRSMSVIHEEARWNIEPVTSRTFAAYGRVVSGFEEECAALVQAVTEHTPLPERLAYIGLTGENTDVSVQL